MKSSVDFYQHVSLHVNLLRYFGLWFYIPYPVDSVWFWVGLLSRVIIGTFTFVISTSAQIAYLVRLALSGKSTILEITGVLNLVVTELVTELKLLDMHLHREKLSELFHLMSSDEFQCRSRTQRETCERAVRVSRWLFFALCVLGFMDVFVHVVLVPALGRFENLPLKMDFIFIDVNDEKYFNFVFAYQILYKPCMLATFTVVQTLPWAAMSFAVSQLDVLIYDFENMKELVKSARVERNCDENEAFRQTFRELVLLHSSIIRFIKVLQNTFGGQLSTYLFASAFILGTTAMQFFSIDSFLQNLLDVVWLLVFLSVFVAMLFIDCYFGNSITNKCEQISVCVFSCPWTDASNELKKDVVIFLARAQRPAVLVAAGLVPVSLETFAMVTFYFKYSFSRVYKEQTKNK